MNTEQNYVGGGHSATSISQTVESDQQTAQSGAENDPLFQEFLKWRATQTATAQDQLEPTKPGGLEPVNRLQEEKLWQSNFLAQMVKSGDGLENLFSLLNAIDDSYDPTETIADLFHSWSYQTNESHEKQVSKARILLNHIATWQRIRTDFECFDNETHYYDKWVKFEDSLRSEKL